MPEGWKLRAAGYGLRAFGSSIAVLWALSCLAGFAQAPSPQPAVRSPQPVIPGFIEIPAGPFVMGGERARDPLAYDNEVGERTIDLPAFLIAQREVTVAEFTAFVQATNWPVDAAALSAPRDHPVRHVSWPDAIGYARWLDSTMKGKLPAGWHVTLPTEAQWEKAAHGVERRRFPWGDEPRRDRANFSAQAPVAAGSIACPECAHGLSDMAGNVWEWTRSPYQPYPYDDANDRADLGQDALWVMRGGGYADGPQLIRTTARGAAEPGARRPFIGFRVVLTPMP